MNKILLKLKQLFCSHLISANDSFGFECIKCKWQCKYWSDLFKHRKLGDY